MAVQLRDYQQKVYYELRKALKTNHNVLVQMPCRSGKSFIMYKICEDAQKKESNVLILSHRNLLNKQTGDLIKLNNVRIENVSTEVRHLGENGYPAIILVDEAHLSATETYTKIFDYYNESILIGFTATPCRLDGKPLGNIYDCIVKGPTVTELIDKGNISQFDYYAPKVNLNMQDVKVGNGDYNLTDLEEVMLDSKIYGDIISNYEKLAKGKQAVAYCVTINHANKICELFNNAGYSCKCIHSQMSMKARQEIMDEFKQKKITIISSVNTISEGITLPTCEVCLMLRPTQSTALFVQQSMRALTPQEGKKAIIIDYVGNCYRHGLPTDEQEYSLKEKTKCRNSNGEPDVLCRRCSNCFLVYPGKDSICPYCGFNNGKTKKEIIEEKQAELEKITEIQRKEKRMEVGMQRDFRGLAEIAKERNYSPGWCYKQAQIKHINIDWKVYGELKRSYDKEKGAYK
nr:MAG TPA: Type I site specific restriction modification protein [Caudoviricetes sp.]